MLESALIVFREGLESFLIVALTLAYLRETGRGHLAIAVFAGAGFAILASIGIGVIADDYAGDPLTEGSLALLSGVLVASMTYHVMRTAKSIRKNLTKEIELHSSKDGSLAYIGLFAFTVLMVLREGVETALLLSSLAQDVQLSTLAAGICSGLAATLLIGFLWVKNAHLINLKLFLQATGAFLILFAIHIAIYGLHELAEAEALPFVDNFEFHTATEIMEPNSFTGQFILYGMIALPCLWLGYSILQDKLRPKKSV